MMAYTRNCSTSLICTAPGPDITTISSRQLVDSVSYGTSDNTKMKEKDSDVLQSQKVPPAVKRSWSGIIEIILNVFGTLGFVKGSLLWCLGISIPGALIFAGSCIFCSISCTIYAYKFYTSNDYIGVYALLQQTLGCVIFTVCSVLVLDHHAEKICLIGFLCASLFFLTGCLLTQVQCRSWLGVLAPIVPNTCDIIPTSLFNTVGSVLFTVGSIFLFYSRLEEIGFWCYEVGSITFFFASWGDATVWWKLGLTQSEHQQTTLQHDYAAVKFL